MIDVCQIWVMMKKTARKIGAWLRNKSLWWQTNKNTVLVSCCVRIVFSCNGKVEMSRRKDDAGWTLRCFLVERENTFRNSEDGILSFFISYVLPIERRCLNFVAGTHGKMQMPWFGQQDVKQSCAAAVYKNGWNMRPGNWYPQMSDLS